MAADILSHSVPPWVYEEMRRCRAPVVHIFCGDEESQPPLVFTLAGTGKASATASTSNKFNWPRKCWAGKPTS